MKVYVMATCPDCAQVKVEAENNPNLQLIDIGEQARNLKEFLALRDTHPAFERVKARGNIGIPCFVHDDGSITFSLGKAKAATDAPSCSIDGTGC